ncbi:2-polyprenyl-6-methoxyphenol hydroxylase-like FAD-dependent oxidoreductase [Litoreibacter ponti]|uniref:2-polyprenyl-6-methoxyphenol hydroxylase-like FAD-dependent oxidoreductase n=1 Tax=Litoreibacter ponti TaxID=1510457 RepID=A0A2T6BIF0_9RHOB|nr:flavin-dependent oxidoreductase [Litoreibacter ponti]PTX55826.1 2-polyprenyl-6-methoxyphenol hydroxylase-like FAD-dependent oxidoreductase [Litoreibacter ponti]
MTVLIAGAGIGGLALGLSLHQVGIPFRIFEAVREIKPLGVGINLQPHAARELFELGLEDALDVVGLRTQEVCYFSAHGQLIWREPRGQAAGYAWPQFSIHRGGLQMALHDALIARCGPKVITTGHAVTTWEETGQGVSVTLTDRASGETLGAEEGTVLIAADGINSTLRATLFPDEGGAKWGGTMMWRGVTDGPAFLSDCSVVMAGKKDQKFVAYPIGRTPTGMRINWIADLTMPEDYDWRAQDWSREGARTDFAAAFADWDFDWLDIPKIIAGAEQVWEYPMVDRDPLAQWTHGPMTLLGDAAHAMYPIGSNGASQCILDARHMAAAMREHGVTQAALHAYENIRRDAVNALVLANRGDGPDKVLDLVAERAPDGFAQIEDVMSHDELDAMAKAYKSVAGMDVDALNARAPII